MNSSRPSSEVHNVLQAGQVALDALNENPAGAVSSVEAYADAFDRWMQQEELQASDKELGMRIADQHATIMMLMDAVKGDAANALKELREKGKGLRAYTDIFPKRISTMKPTKG